MIAKAAKIANLKKCDYLPDRSICTDAIASKKNQYSLETAELKLLIKTDTDRGLCFLKIVSVFVYQLFQLK